MLRFSCLLLSLTLSPALFAAVDPALLDLVPPDAVALYGVDVPKTLASPLGKDAYARVLVRNPLLDRVGPVLGFDAKRDLRELLLVTEPHAAQLAGNYVSPQPPKLGRQPIFDLILARGTFHVERFVSVASIAGGSATEDRGVKVIRMASANPARAEYLALLDPSTAAIGSPAAIQALIGRRIAKSGYHGTLAEKATSATGDVWFATSAPLAALLNHDHTRAQAIGVEAVENALQGATGNIVFADGSATLSIAGNTRSEGEAKTFAAALQGALLLIKNPRVFPLKNAQITASAATLEGKVAMSSAELERLLFRPAPAMAVAGNRLH